MLVAAVLGCARPVARGAIVVEVDTDGAPSDLEVSVAAPLEAQIAKLEGVESVRTRIDDRGVRIEAWLSGPAEDALVRLRETLSQASLPSDLPRPVIGALHDGDETVWLRIEGEADRVRFAIEGEPAVLRARLCAPVREVQLRIDPQRAAAVGVGLPEIEAALRGSGDLSRPLALEDLPKLSLGGDHRLSDLAVIERGEGRAACVGQSSGGPVSLLQVTLRAGYREKLQQAVTAIGGVEMLASVTPIELRRDPARAEVARAVAVATNAIVLDRVDGTGLVLAHSPEAAERAREVSGVIAAWDPASAVSLRLTGPDYDALDQLASEAKRLLVAAGARMDLDEAPPRTAIEVEIDAERAESAGIDRRALAASVAASVGELPMGEVASGRELLPLVLKLGSADGAEGIQQITLSSPGGSVPLTEVATLTRGIERSRLRLDGHRALEIAVSGASRETIAETIVQLSLPPGYAATLAP